MLQVNEMMSVLENFNLFSQKFFLPPKPRASALGQKQEILNARHTSSAHISPEKTLCDDDEQSRSLASSVDRTEISDGATVSLCFVSKGMDNQLSREHRLLSL